MPDPNPTLNPRISFACPNCGLDLRAAESLGGRVTVCPYCERKLTVPTVTGEKPVSGNESVIDSTVVVKHPPPRAAS